MSPIVILEEDLRLHRVWDEVLDAIHLPDDDHSILEEQVTKFTNDLRLAYGLQPLCFNPSLHRCARRHSQELAGRRLISHVGQDGSHPSARVSRAGYQFWLCVGENVAVGSLTAEGVVKAWFDSPNHRSNLLNSQFNEIGVGIHSGLSPAPYNAITLYWTQNFGFRPHRSIFNPTLHYNNELLSKIKILDDV